MEKTEPLSNKHILFCKCGGERMPKEVSGQVEELLKDLPGRVTIFSDLCGLRVHQPGKIKTLITQEEEYLVLGCYQRTMSRFLETPVNKDSEPRIQYVNLTEEIPIETLQSQLETFSAGTTRQPHQILTEDSGWPAWYPVVDYDRCTGCGQCADFCLFGVYEKTSQGVRVVNPQGCKNNCPACARICPFTAIIFPKYKNGGAIAGSDLIDEQAEQKRQALDIENFLGDDIYAALAQRKIKRQSIIRDEAMKRAFQERDKALKNNDSK